MTDALTLVLVALVCAIGGGAGGGLIAAFALKGEDKRYDARLGPINDALEDLDDRLLQWQRKVTKRERDALRSSKSDDHGQGEAQIPLSLRDRMAAIRQRAMRG